MRRSKFLAAALLFTIASCAVITVNVYFPEKDVKEAYKNLEKELMSPGGGSQGQKPENGAGARSPVRPESSIRFELATPAYAQDTATEERIVGIVKNMPDVVAAYRGIGARLPELNKLRDRGAVGEGSDGLLAVREGPLSPAEKQLVDEVNKDRQTVMRGMAKAIVRLNRLPESAENLKQVAPRAVEQFASIRRDSARKGWWIQEPGGSWTKK